jgi:dTDP-glucose pyrophosphorylase
LKQLDGFGPHNEPIIMYSIYDALRFGCDNVVFVIRQDFEAAFVETIGSIVEKYVRVSYVFQTKELFVPDEYNHLIQNREKPR